VTKIAVLVSGTGSNLEAIIQANLPVVLVVADRPCPALDLAKSHHIDAILVDRAAFGFKPATVWDRAGFTHRVTSELQNGHVDLVAMAGFMTVMAPEIFHAYEDRVLNTHPSLLPDFKGAHAIPRALEAGVAITGCTIHIATAELDSGRILAQSQVPVIAGDTPETLHARVKVVERRLYPDTIKAYLNEKRPSSSQS
jgi:phosphoribosylglycinamide formyltransferase-1